MTKYAPLERHLRNQRLDEVPMTFAEVEKILGAPLPRSAYKHRPWWANDPTGHAHAKAWLGAGFHTERVDMEAQKLVFVGLGGAAVASDAASAGARTYERHPLLGSLKGLGRAAPGVDLADPADPDWGERSYGDNR